MAEISLKRPFILSIVLIGWDASLPSVQTQIHIESKGFDSTLELNFNSIWFVSSSFDQFTSSLLNDQTALLMDMDRMLTIQVASPSEGLELTINHKKYYSDDRWVNTELAAKLDQDSLANLKEQFKNLPKWW
ncbi:hypothetical protein [Spirosoma endophyticum]|uniref:Uncharacterized protein n=1 Tax=Spirosoma endophyticum TaxID=662367 RepID=A0A1I2I9E4_9BACT|nr:hypothetical protein [Spirosoma endophyticum]SFF38220.1 hypothetical protein SAMN05216167_1599 [Spirosoma endophyticum]